MEEKIRHLFEKNWVTCRESSKLAKKTLIIKVLPIDGDIVLLKFLFNSFIIVYLFLLCE